jgi:hypothetical protein
MISYTANAPKPIVPRVLKPGDYPFRILDASEERSKSGNDMIKLKMMVGHDRESEIGVFDYLVFGGSCDWKIDSFLKCVGLHPGEGQNLDISGTDMIGREGIVKLKIEEYLGKESNKVSAYLYDEDNPKTAPVKVSPQAEADPDHMPF